MDTWFKFIKKYVWDDTKTPYLTPVGKLSRTQADYEIFAYALFIGVLFLAVALAMLSAQALTGPSPGGPSPGGPSPGGPSPGGPSYGAAFYALSVAGSAIMFGMTKEIYTAIYCGLAPAAALLYFMVKGFPPHLQTLDKILVIVAALLLLRYSLRIVAIAKAYEQLSDG